MQFYEVNGNWMEIPQWVNYFINFGYNWAEKIKKEQQICLFSIPCDSAAAGIITLGVMRKYLEDPDASDRKLHLQRIRNSSKTNQYLCHKTRRGKYQYDCEDEYGLWVKLVNADGRDRTTINENTACDWYFENESFVEDILGGQLSNELIYHHLIDNKSSINDNNLHRSHSGICLAGRSAGESKTREIMSKIKFKHEKMESKGLDQLLTVHNWSERNISRVSFYNTRTKKKDRESIYPTIVVADGDGAFLSVLDEPVFDQSDIIATIDRTIDRDRIEAVINKMTGISQWFMQEEIIANDLRQIPYGITVSIWKKR